MKLSKIKITENDNSNVSTNINTSNNIVFVPGLSTKGSKDEPILCRNTDSFEAEFGGPIDGDISYLYAYDLIDSGFPVLFRRISPEKTSTTEGSTTASVNIFGSSEDNSLKVYYKNPGSYGNSIVLFFNKRSTSSNRWSYSLYVYRIKPSDASSLYIIERASLLVNSDLTGADLDSELANALIEYSSMNKSVVFDVTELMTTSRTLGLISGLFVDVALGSKYTSTNSQYYKMDGGTDATYERASQWLTETSSNNSTVTNAEEIYMEVHDKLLYDVKFITTGGFITPSTKESFKIINLAMYKLANTRKDVFVLVDTDSDENSQSVQSAMEELLEHSVRDNGYDDTYGGTYAPWCLCKLRYNKKYVWMPGSYVMLRQLANSVKNGNPIYNAPAGVKRATLDFVASTKYKVSSSLMEEWQDGSDSDADYEIPIKCCINPIIYINEYGYTIFGQRTTSEYYPGENSVNSSLTGINVRLAANEIKKEIYRTCLSLSFDNNVMKLWDEFYIKMTNYLDVMKSNNGVNAYKVVMDESTMTEDDINNGRVKGIVSCAMTVAGEYFNIAFNIEKSTVTFTDEYAISSSDFDE